jgi:hypothetical protein
MRSLHLGHGLTLPIEAATQTFLVVGKRGSGKSNTAAVLAEQFFHAGVPFVVVDPTDTWWGLKSSKDGKGPGLSVYIFGGRHADVPLEATVGTTIADVLVEHRISAVLSIKHLPGRERGRFVADLTRQLFQKNTEPLHIFLEEAHEVAPQNPFKGEEEMLGHVARIWKLGRSSGLGGSAITQRPASLSKNITTQAEILIVHRTLGPQDVAAIREWIRYHGEREEILAELSTLKTGEAFIWAPDFPEGHPIGLKRVMMHQRETFDSAATPKTGERRAEPKALAPVDLERLRTKMAATIERAKAEDPRELRRQLAEVKAQLAKAEKTVPARKEKRVAVKVNVLNEPLVRRLEVATRRAKKTAERRAKVVQVDVEAQGRLLAALEGLRGRLEEVRRSWPAAGPGRIIPARRIPTTDLPAEGLDGPQQRILDTILMLVTRGIPLSREAVARWQDLHPNGGRYNRGLASLRAAGYLDGLTLTSLGMQHARPRDTGSDAALAALPDESKRRILIAIIKAGRALSREALAELLELHPNGGRFNRDLAWLRTMGVIPERGAITPMEGLFR